MTSKRVDGRQRKTSPCDDNLIQQIAAWSPSSSCKKIYAALLLKGTDVHHTTASRHLVYDFNLKAFKPAKNLAKPQPCKRPLPSNEDWDEPR